MTGQQFRTLLLRLAAASAAAAIAMWQSDDLDDDERLEAVAATVDAHRSQGVGLGDLFAAATMGLLPLGVAPADERGRLVDALGTLLRDVETRDDATARVGRLAAAEPAGAAQDATMTAYSQRGVNRVVRRTSADACPLCTTLAAEGAIPAGWRFARHPGCSCYPIPA